MLPHAPLAQKQQNGMSWLAIDPGILASRGDGDDWLIDYSMKHSEPSLIGNTMRLGCNNQRLCFPRQHGELDGSPKDSVVSIEARLSWTHSPSHNCQLAICIDRNPGAWARTRPIYIFGIYLWSQNGSSGLLDTKAIIMRTLSIVSFLVYATVSSVTSAHSIRSLTRVNRYECNKRLSFLPSQNAAPWDCA